MPPDPVPAIRPGSAIERNADSYAEACPQISTLYKDSLRAYKAADQLWHKVARSEKYAATATCHAHSRPHTDTWHFLTSIRWLERRSRWKLIMRRASCRWILP